MYNRYIPKDAAYTRVTEDMPKEEPVRREPEGTAQPEQHPQPPRQPTAQHSRTPQNGAGNPGSFRLPSFLGGKDGLYALFSGKERGGLSGLLKTLHLEEIDTGDILLLLIVLYLLVEGDDLELVIALGLVLIMGLGDEKQESKGT